MKIFKKIYNILPITILSFLLLLLVPSTINAAQFHFKSYTLPAEETVYEDIYVVADTIKIDGVIDGDVILLADTVQLNGTITGDAYLMGGKIDVDATVYGNTFVFANNSTVGGLLTGNTYLASSFLNYNADSEGDLFAFFLESNIKGSVGDDLRAFGIRSKVDSIVRGDLLLIGEQHTASEEKVSGNIFYNSTIEGIAKDQGVEIDRMFKFETPTLRRDWNLKAASVGINFLSLLLVGYFIISLTPVKSIEIRKRITDSTDDFLKSLGIGFVLAIVIPIPLFILFISIIGTPLAVFITGLLSFVMIFGKIWVETAFGKEILELFGVKEYRPFKSFLVGRVLTTVVSFIPIVRGFYNTIVVLVALGAIVRMKNSYYKIAKEQVTKPKTTKKK
jgi:hypothetical protein